MLRLSVCLLQLSQTICLAESDRFIKQLCLVTETSVSMKTNFQQEVTNTAAGICICVLNSEMNMSEIV